MARQKRLVDTMNAKNHSYTQEALDLFTSRPGERFSAWALAHTLGIGGWRTRVSQARKILEGRGDGTILNEQENLPSGVRASTYWFEPSGGARYNSWPERTSK